MEFHIPILDSRTDPEVFWRLLVKDFGALPDSRKIAFLRYREDGLERVSQVGDFEEHRGRKLLCIAILETVTGAVVVVADRHKLLEGFQVEPLGEPALFGTE